MNRTLNNIHPGEAVKVTRISVGGQLRRRLIEMGVLPGVIIEVIRIAPLGDPMEVKIRKMSLTLRKCEAAKIEVEDIVGHPAMPHRHRHRHGTEREK
jgi:Fe2+ transport system protein FeoA